MTATDLLGRVRSRLADRAAASTDPRVTVGDRLVLVELSHPDDGRLAGLAHRPEGAAPAAWPDRVRDLAALAAEPPTAVDPVAPAGPPAGADPLVARAVGVATLNALSAGLVDWTAGDPMAALTRDVGTVATVGLFRPAFRKFAAVDVRVVERDPPADVEAPPGVSVSTYAPGECARAFAGADVCFVTGSALVYGGVDRYLAALSAADVSPVVLVGATASHLPAPAFAAGVDVVAGARVVDPDRTRQRVAAGDCGTDLHGGGVEKCYVARSGDLPGLALPGRETDAGGDAARAGPTNTEGTPP